jgi:hypothetical protein
MEERQNRRAKGTSAGEKRCDDERSRSELARFSPATGDRGSPVVLPVIISIARQARQCSLCVSASLRLCVLFSGGRPSCLCGCDVGGRVRPMFFAVLTKKAEKSEANRLICLSAFYFVVPFVAPYLCGRSPRSFR